MNTSTWLRQCDVAMKKGLRNKETSTLCKRHTHKHRQRARKKTRKEKQEMEYFVCVLKNTEKMHTHKKCIQREE